MPSFSSNRDRSRFTALLFTRFGWTKYLIPLFSLGLAFWLNAEADQRREAFQSTLSPELFLERVDINHASSHDIEALPHIGKSLAERIVQYRRQNGFYRTPADILKVRGIGPKRLEQIKPYFVLLPHDEKAQ